MKKVVLRITPTLLQKHVTDKTKWLILNSPSNPTGAVYSKEELTELSKVVLQYEKLHVISDDIYEYIRYNGGRFDNLVSVEDKLSNRVLIVNGVSKSYSMTGWRIGYGLCKNKVLIEKMSDLQSQSTTNPCSISQAAAVEALSGTQDYVVTRNAEFRKRKDELFKLFNNISGLSCIEPEGAFYLFINVSKLFGKKTAKGKLISDSLGFCQYLLEDSASSSCSRYSIWL